MSGLRPTGSIDCLKGFAAGADPKGEAVAGPALNGLSALTGRPLLLAELRPIGVEKGLALAVEEEEFRICFQNCFFSSKYTCKYKHISRQRDIAWTVGV